MADDRRIYDDFTASNTDPAPLKPLSIYDLRSPARKRLILAIAASISLLTPVTDTIILPALISINAVLPGSTPDTNAAIISVYMGAVGLLNLFWGPLSDRFGRRIVLQLTLVAYLGITIACVFAPSAAGLLALRAAQGAVTGAATSVTQGVVADVFAPRERGMAMGLYFLPLLVGPIIAPVVGGLVTGALDWRAVFMFCAALAAPELCLATALPETHQWLFLRARERDAEAAAEAAAAAQHSPSVVAASPTETASLDSSTPTPIAAVLPPAASPAPSASAAVSLPLTPVLEEALGEVPRPQMRPPWAPLHFLVEPALAPYAAVGAAAFGGMFVSFTVFPSILSAPPFSFSPSAVGAAYLPAGVSLLVASVWGGHASDAAGHKRPFAPTARLLPSLLGACALPPGALLFGWAAWAAAPTNGQPGASAPGALAGILLGHALIGFGQSSYLPGFFAYISAAKQAAAAAAGAVAMALFFAIAAASISAAVPIQAALNIGGLFSLIAGINVAIIAWAALDFTWRWRRELALAASGGAGGVNSSGSNVGSPSTTTPSQPSAGSDGGGDPGESVSSVIVIPQPGAEAVDADGSTPRQARTI